MNRIRFATLLLAMSLLPIWGLSPTAYAASALALKTVPGAPKQPAAADLKQLLATLQDAHRRDALIAQIKALIAIQEGAITTNADQGVGAQILGALSSGFAWTARTLDVLGENLRDPSGLLTSLAAQFSKPTQRRLWLRTLGYAGLSLAAGLLALLLVGRATGRGARPAQSGEPLPWFRRLRSASARLALDILPIVAFAAVAFAVAAAATLPETPRLALLAVINAAALSLVGNAVVRALLNPMVPTLRLLPVENATAAYLYIWARRMIALLVWGYVALEVAVLLGLPHATYIAAAKLFGLFVTLMLVVFVLQNRQAIAARLRRGANGLKLARVLPSSLRARLSEVWHIVACAYLVALYFVWALGIPGGLAYLLRASIETAIVVALLLLIESRMRRGIDWLLGVEAGMLARYPMVAQRADRYLPAVRVVLVSALRLAALLAVLAAWQIDVGNIVLSPVGSTVLGRLTVIGIILALALLTWEVSSGAITAYLDRHDDAGQALVRSARLRTLLPLIRNVLLVTISVLATLVILSELGVNIAPLLAGAGVVGLALGFGAQTLVKDVITGAFILFEGTISVGDVAEINGKSGLVEGLTIRSIRLRDLSGNVHTITFGSVESITNMTKEYSYYLLDVGVAYRENTDEVVALLREIDEELRADEVFGAKIIAPLEILGVDRFADSAVYVRARTKTRPIQQWNVGREFNRRMKLKFDSHGIEIPFPHRTIYFGEDKQGSAPPAHIALRHEPGRGERGDASATGDSSPAGGEPSSALPSAASK